MWKSGWKTRIKPIAITAGEPAGIGPDLCLMLAQRELPVPVVALADKGLLRERALKLGLAVNLTDYRVNQPPEQHVPGTLPVLHTALGMPVQAGRLETGNARYVLTTLDNAVTGCTKGVFAALVTAPVHKGVINDAGIPFTGHTEYLAEKTRTSLVVMMLTGGKVVGPDRGPLRVALATTHLPLKDVPAAITPALLEDILRILHLDLVRRFGIGQPRILVSGLNPHAGEGGHLGLEEIQVIIPVLDKLRAEGMNLVGPLPADTLFTPRVLAGSDAQLAMYHDQGLAVLKHASFGEGVNVTLGLPFIRTSVDHGTALDLAGTGKAEVGSLVAALDLAVEMAKSEERPGPPGRG